MFLKNSHQRYPGILLILLLSVALASGVQAAGNTVITPASPGAWSLTQSGLCGGTNTSTQGEVDPGPGTPPYGTGSYGFTIGTDGDSFEDIYNTIGSPIPLSNVTTLSYYTYAINYNNGQLPWITLYLDTTGSGSDWDQRLVFEPLYSDGGYETVDPSVSFPAQPSTQEGAWQQWNALAGGWYGNTSGGDPIPFNTTFGEAHDTGTNGPYLTTIAHYLSHYPNARIINRSGAGAIRVAAGCGGAAWQDFDGAFDGFALGVSGSTTTYDFELKSTTPPSTGGSSGSTQVSTVPCNLVGGGTSTSVVNANAQPNQFCRIIVENGTYIRNAAEVGDVNLISQGVTQAVDIFAFGAAGEQVTTFSQPLTVCLQGSGKFYFRDANGQPRTTALLTSTVLNGYTCATIPNAGTVILSGSAS